jgi:hypothetical protein
MDNLFLIVVWPFRASADAFERAGLPGELPEKCRRPESPVTGRFSPARIAGRRNLSCEGGNGDGPGMRKLGDFARPNRNPPVAGAP